MWFSGEIFYKYQLCQVNNGATLVNYILVDFLLT